MPTNKKIYRYIFISSALHFCLLAVLILQTNYRQKDESNHTLEVSVLSSEEAAKLRLTPNAKTIVESDSQTANHKLNESAKFLSEKTNSVEKETRAKFGQKYKNTKGFSSKKNNIFKNEIFKNNFDPYASLTNQNENNKLPANKPHQKQNSFDRTPGSTDSGSELATTNDNLKNIENEFLTRLNTREYKYFGYYNRIKTQLNQWWVPQVQQRFSKMVRQGRMIASEESKVTKLVIVLSDQGQLVKVQVLAESGVRDLDEAAIEAFRQAAPFPNPPKGMIESDGTVKIRWDCVVES